MLLGDLGNDFIYFDVCDDCFVTITGFLSTKPLTTCSILYLSFHKASSPLLNELFDSWPSIPVSQKLDTAIFFKHTSEIPRAPFWTKVNDDCSITQNHCR